MAAPGDERSGHPFSHRDSCATDAGVGVPADPAARRRSRFDGGRARAARVAVETAPRRLDRRRFRGPPRRDRSAPARGGRGGRSVARRGAEGVGLRPVLRARLARCGHSDLSRRDDAECRFDARRRGRARAPARHAGRRARRDRRRLVAVLDRPQERRQGARPARQGARESEGSRRLGRPRPLPRAHDRRRPLRPRNALRRQRNHGALRHSLPPLPPLVGHRSASCGRSTRARWLTRSRPRSPAIHSRRSSSPRSSLPPRWQRSTSSIGGEGERRRVPSGPM